MIKRGAALIVRNLGWLALYGLMVWMVVGGMFQARRKLVPVLSSPQAQTDWEVWRARTRAQSQPGEPVLRKPAKSPEPNLLVLLRDYFAVCVGFVMVFLSLLFLAMMIFIRGALRTPPPVPADR